MRRGRRRQRATWFPILPFTDGDIGRTDDRRVLGVSPDPGTSDIAWTPLIPDESGDIEDASSAGFTLRDFVEGQTCIIERVVGKITWAVDNTAGAEYSPRLIVCASALAILPVDELGNVGIPSDEFDPLRAQNSSQPFYWRRTWLLTNQAQLVGQASRFTTVASNAFGGSNQTGPHIDTKGVRRAIRREQRLFLIHSVLSADPVGSPTTGLSGAAYVHADLRVLGHMTRSTNKSTFK